jgi:hypothetical protein
LNQGVTAIDRCDQCLGTMRALAVADAFAPPSQNSQDILHLQI